MKKYLEKVGIVISLLFIGCFVGIMLFVGSLVGLIISPIIAIFINSTVTFTTITENLKEDK